MNLTLVSYTKDTGMSFHIRNKRRSGLSYQSFILLLSIILSFRSLAANFITRPIGPQEVTDFCVKNEKVIGKFVQRKSIV